MRKFIFLIIFVLISAGFSATPFDMGQCNYTYNISGGFVMEEVTSFDVAISAIPHVCDPFAQTNVSNNNKEIVISEQDPYSPYIWSFECEFPINKELVSFESPDSFPKQYNVSYLEFGHYSDFSPEIFEKSSLIVEGSQTTLGAGMKIAKWVHENVQYDRDYDSFYEDEKGRASQVFETRKGVCDEFTNLFVSMARSVGIPARYVSGVAYSDLYDGYGMHAWAEFFAGRWVPVDLTFGEFGVVDASHIPLSRSFDGNFTPISMSWTGYEDNSFSVFNPFESRENRVMGPEKFSIFLDPECQEEQNIFPFEVTIDRHSISDNDYSLISVEFENPYEKYVVLPIRFRRIQSMELAYGSYEDFVLLSPLGKTIKKYLIHVEDLDNAYTYSLPLRINPDFSRAWNRTIQVNPSQESRPFSHYVENISQVTQMSPDLAISNLRFEPNPSYENTMFLLFSAKNMGNKIMNLSLELIHNGEEQDFDLGQLIINQEKNHNLTIFLNNTGEFNTVLNFYSENLSLTRQALVVRAPVPDTRLVYEGPTNFTDSNIEFNISREKCYSGKIYLITSVSGIMYDQDKFNFNPPHEMFYPGTNKLNISLFCVDVYGNPFFNSTSQKITIHVQGLDYVLWLIKSVVRRIMNFFEPKLL